MNHLRFLFIVALAAIASNLQGQISISLDPTNMAPTSRTITVSAAGTNPANPINNYTTQKIKYRWPTFDQGIFGAIYVQSTTIPSGLSMTNLVTGSSGFWGSYGTSTGTITISTTPQALVTGIWNANITRGMTQNLLISDFANLHPGTTVVTINYSFY